MRRVQALAALILLTVMAPPSQAQSLTVSPVTMDLPYGVASTVFVIETGAKEGVATQVRVFRWSQTGGQDKLEKTEDVIVSPPVLTVRGGAPSTIRLVRVAKAPVTGEESYRVLIDQLPDRKSLQAGTVSMTIRQSLPVFFAGEDARPGSLTWKTAMQKGKLVLEAFNGGQTRVKLLKLSVADGKNRELVKNAGLAYVLGGQTRSWELSPAPSGSTLSIKAESDKGPIIASAIAGRG